MTNNNELIIDEETIRQVGLQLSNDPVNATLAPNTRVFRYPHLKDVFILESDLYGNVMPKGSCFLAFYGRNGLMGKHLKMETLQKATAEEIKEMVESNAQG